MKLTVKDSKGNARGEIEVRVPLIEDGSGSQALHDVIVAYQAAQRSGTACTKTMGEVAGTGKKPWRQKGTGRARAGSFASPLWRGGGVVFGPKPRDFRKKVNKRTRQLALRKALSERLHAGEVVVIEELKLETAKTRELVGVLAALEVAGDVVLVVAQIDESLTRAARNLGEVRLVMSVDLNAYQVLAARRLIFTRAAWEQLEKRVQEGGTE